MYITITGQKKGETYSSSCKDFVAYLEKENEGLEAEDQEQFFSHDADNVEAASVIESIDTNKYKLKEKDTKFFSVTLNPSKRELKHLWGNTEALKAYTREVMNEYAKNFNRKIGEDQRPLQGSDLVYYAKVERGRDFKYYDKEVRENAPYLKEIARLEREKSEILKGTKQGDVKEVDYRLWVQRNNAPHTQDGVVIDKAMQKQGSQDHVHIIVSRMDKSKRVSLSPTSKYKSSTVEMHGKQVQRGFNRDAFFEKAEKSFDKKFSFERNYVDSYRGRNDYLKRPKTFVRKVLKLPTSQRGVALQLLKDVPILKDIPLTKKQAVQKVIRVLSKAIFKERQMGI